MKSESEVAQLCQTLLDPMDCSLPGSFVYGIFQAIVLEWVAIFFSRVLFSLLLILVTWTPAAAAAAAAKSLQSGPTVCNPTVAAHQTPPSLGFSRQEHWTGLPFPSPMHESEK